MKTCRELDLFWEPDATEGGVTVTAGEPRVLPACIKKKKMLIETSQFHEKKMQSSKYAVLQLVVRNSAKMTGNERKFCIIKPTS